MAIHVALVLTLLGSLGLALVLLAWAVRITGAALLTCFLCGVAAWVVGNELPTWFGPRVERVALSLMGTASLTSAVFLHFSLVFTGAPPSRRFLAWTYGIAGSACLVSVVIPCGRFVPFAGVALMAVPNAAGWVTSAAWAILAGAGLVVLGRAVRSLQGQERRRVAALMTASAWGLLCMSGYAIAALDLPIYPWPLLLLPLYPVILVYGIMRYRVFVANAWARRAIVWTTLVGLALTVVALVPLLPIQGDYGRVTSGILVVAACLALAGPIRSFAERIVYPGGVVSAADIAAWRDALRPCGDQESLARDAGLLLSGRLGVVVTVTVDGHGEEAPFAQPTLACRRIDGGWRTLMEGWDAAPPGRRRLAEVFGIVLADQASRLEDAAILVARERDRQVEGRLAELGQIALTVAHDIRNPLNVISMAAAIVDPEVRVEIKEQVDRISRLSRDLLDYARPWNVETAEMDFREQVLFVTRRYRDVETSFPTGPMRLHADPYRVDQALTNLLDNAVATGARVSVTGEADERWMRLHVCDEGPGLPADLRDRVFQPFVSRAVGGTGLGLAIVSRIMAAHGGTVEVSDRPGWSTSFTLNFPRIPA